ncbi:MAG: dihydroorotate dehydrogenase electron transfer subunit [Oscillospiraceae bacterium]|nr:dihydroorotate dehydrogenase electron transfer subunit [Oscillospiraceae bacterium]
MKYDVKQCKILSKQELTKGIFSFVVQAGEMAKTAQPGQFANLLAPGKTLRRPISICEIDKEQETLRFVFEIRGEGTQLLSEFAVGDSFDILGPLGNGFQLGDTKRKALFVGGGIGVPPLLQGAKAFGENATVVLGFRSQNAMILREDFEQAGCKVIVATDDGSYGHHGLVTDCIGDVEADVIFACGPMPMLKALTKVADDRKIECQISLEERMACGIGACLGCACRIRREDGSETFGHVCKDGPVFDYHKVVF